MLKDGVPYPTGLVGHDETFSVYPPGVLLTSASYRTDAEPQGSEPAISADLTTLTLKVLRDVGTVAVTVNTADSTISNFWLYQGNMPFRNVRMQGSIQQGLGTTGLHIEGLPD